MKRLSISLFVFAAAAVIFPGFAVCDYGAGRAVSGSEVIPGRVRAEVVRDAKQLPGGPKAEGRVGDFLLSNSSAAFVVAGARPASGMCPYGGVVEDAALVESSGGGLRYRNIAGDVCLAVYQGGDPLTGGRLFKPETARILKDGSDGEAIVRFEGSDAEFPTRRELLLRKSKAINASITVDYILRADSPALGIRLTFKNDSDKDKNLSAGMMFLFGDGVPLFVPGPGFNSSAFRSKETGFIAASGSGIAYGWFPADGGMTVYDQLENLMLVTAGRLKAPAGGSGSLGIYYVVQPEGVANVQAEMHRILGSADTGRVDGSCALLGSGKPVRGALVHALTTDGSAVVSQAVSGADGKFSFTLPAGEYSFQATLPESADPAPHVMGVQAGKRHETLFGFETPASVDFRITDGRGKSIPAAIAFVPRSELKSAADDPRFQRLRRYSNKYLKGYYKVAFAPLSGKTRVLARPGSYDVYVSRGTEYEIEKKTFELKPGANAKFAARLAHSVDSSGYLCGDFHLHTGASHDADDRLEDTVAGLAAYGVEIPVSADHDRIQDYAPMIKSRGLSSLVNSTAGIEFTTKRMGHFNVFPVAYKPDEINGGAIDWMQKKIPELFAEARRASGRPVVIQVNHPRIAMMGYFTSISFDSAAAAAADKDNFSMDYDLIEVLNGVDYDKMETGIQDWINLQNQGIRKTITGSSDSHTIFTLEAGYPRNCIMSKTDDPAKMKEADFVRALKGGESVINGGAFIWMKSGGAGPGGLARGRDGAAALDIEVYSPVWADVSKLTLLQNGIAIKTIPLKPSKTALRYRGRITVNSNSDAWYAARVDGEKPLFPVYPHARAFAMTNALFVDFDGNGKFDAPGKKEDKK